MGLLYLNSAHVRLCPGEAKRRKLGGYPTEANIGEPYAYNWGSRGRRFKSCQPDWGSRGFFRHEPGFSPCSALHGFGGQQLRATGGFFWGLSCGFAGNVAFGARNESPAVGLPV